MAQIEDILVPKNDQHLGKDFSYQNNVNKNVAERRVTAGIDLRRKVLENSCTFSAIAQFLPVRAVVSVAQTDRSMRRTVLQLNNHWSCGWCHKPVFQGIGMPNSCEDVCRAKSCPNCTDRCEFCNEVKCFACELFLCACCDATVCEDCERNIRCNCDHEDSFCPNCAEICEKCNHPATCEFCLATLCCCEVRLCSCCGDHPVCLDCKRTCSSCVRSEYVCPACSSECAHCCGVHCMYCVMMG